MYWQTPRDEHIVYEALSALADGRLELTDENHARCTSTSRGKYYTITYDPALPAIMSDDNMAYYRDEISYPMVAFLLARGEFEFNQDILQDLKDIKWKDINQKNRNNYLKSVKEVLAKLKATGVDTKLLQTEVANIFKWICNLKLKKSGEKQTPPDHY